MASTAHGITYPVMTDLPDVPGDIGGPGKLDQSTQTWLAALDTTNLASLATVNGNCASMETTVAGVNTSINTAVTRQNGQQASVNAITARNTSVTSRLNARDTTLATDSTTVAGFGGAISGMNSTKGRGLVQAAFPPAIDIASGTTGQFGSITFNDPAPSSSRIYRASVQCSASMGSGQSGALYYVYLSMAWQQGTTFTNAANESWLTILGDPYESVKNFSIEFVFSGIPWSQWTLWIFSQNSTGGRDYWLGRLGIPHITLEDIGLQL
jgi:hypothetical protein